MSKWSGLALITLLLGSAALVSPTFAQPEKVDVCHITGNGSYRLINISERALDAHIAHGDAMPGDAVDDETILSEDCTADEVITVTSSALNFSSTGWGGWSCPASHPNAISGSTTATEPLAAEGLAEPGATIGGFTYPTFPHYTFGDGEEGYVVQNGGTPQSLTISVVCSE